MKCTKNALCRIWGAKQYLFIYRAAKGFCYIMVYNEKSFQNILLRLGFFKYNEFDITEAYYKIRVVKHNVQSIYCSFRIVHCYDIQNIRAQYHL